MVELEVGVTRGKARPVTTATTSALLTAMAVFIDCVGYVKCSPPLSSPLPLALCDTTQEKDRERSFVDTSLGPQPYTEGETSLIICAFAGVGSAGGTAASAARPKILT